MSDHKLTKPTIITEIKGDLFSAPPDWCLGHCVSRDLHMNKGIARIFRQRFGGVPELKAQNKHIGEVAYLENVVPVGDPTEVPAVFYLITKEKYWGKPTYATLHQTLTNLRRIMESKGLYKLALPAIGCGLDRLEWPKVRSMLEQIFEGSGIDILIHFL